MDPSQHSENPVETRIGELMASPTFQEEVFATVRSAIVDENVAPALRLKAALKCLDKMTPSLKSVDHRGMHPVTITFVSCLDGAKQAKADAAELAAKRKAELLQLSVQVPSLSEGLPPAKEEVA